MLFESDYNPDTGNPRSLVQPSDAVAYGLGLEGEPMTDAELDARPEERSKNPERYTVYFADWTFNGRLYHPGYSVEAHSTQEAERMAQEIHGTTERATSITQPWGSLRYTCDEDRRAWREALSAYERRFLDAVNPLETKEDA